MYQEFLYSSTLNFIKFKVELKANQPLIDGAVKATGKTSPAAKSNGKL